MVQDFIGKGKTISLSEWLKSKLLKSTKWTNEYADGQDVKRNSINYGAAIICSELLKELGYEVFMPVWNDNKYIRVGKIEIMSSKKCYFHEKGAIENELEMEL